MGLDRTAGALLHRALGRARGSGRRSRSRRWRLPAQPRRRPRSSRTVRPGRGRGVRGRPARRVPRAGAARVAAAGGRRRRPALAARARARHRGRIAAENAVDHRRRRARRRREHPPAHRLRRRPTPTRPRGAYVAFGAVMDLALELGGTITGEHGVGRLKAAWLPDHLGDDVMALTRRIKDALDPQGILNPGRRPLAVAARHDRRGAGHSDGPGSAYCAGDRDAVPADRRGARSATGSRSRCGCSASSTSSSRSRSSCSSQQRRSRRPPRDEAVGRRRAGARPARRRRAHAQPGRAGRAGRAVPAGLGRLPRRPRLLPRAFTRTACAGCNVLAGVLIVAGVAALTLPRRSCAGQPHRPAGSSTAIVAAYAARARGDDGPRRRHRAASPPPSAGVLFLASDTRIAHDRFVGRVPHGPVLVIVTYHLAQLLILIGLIRTGGRIG